MQDQSPTIGFIGLGVMGGPMCRNVVGKHPAQVYAFDQDPAAMADCGALAARSIAEVAAASDIILLSLPGGKQVEEVCFGKEGVAVVSRRGLIVVDLGNARRAEVDHDRAVPPQTSEAVPAETDLLNLLAAGKGQEDDVGGRR